MELKYVRLNQVITSVLIITIINNLFGFYYSSLQHGHSKNFKESNRYLLDSLLRRSRCSFWFGSIGVTGAIKLFSPFILNWCSDFAVSCLFIAVAHNLHVSRAYFILRWHWDRRFYSNAINYNIKQTAPEWVTNNGDFSRMYWRWALRGYKHRYDCRAHLSRDCDRYIRWTGILPF